MLTLSVAWSWCWSAKHTSNINIRANLSTLAEIAIRSIVIVTIKPNMSIVLTYLLKPMTLLPSKPIEVTIHLIMIISYCFDRWQCILVYRWWLNNRSRVIHSIDDTIQQLERLRLDVCLSSYNIIYLVFVCVFSFDIIYLILTKIIDEEISC